MHHGRVPPEIHVDATLGIGEEEPAGEREVEADDVVEPGLTDEPVSGAVVAQRLRVHQASREQRFAFDVGDDDASLRQSFRRSEMLDLQLRTAAARF